MEAISKLEMFAFIIVIVLAQSLLAQKPWEPLQRTEPLAVARHQAILGITAQQKDQIKVVFLGSSIIENWNTAGLSVWNQYYAPIGAVNYGVSGDRTEHLLWRIANGELDGLSPKLVVLSIGSNNVPANPSNLEIALGVNAVVDKIHEKLPNANILVVGIFPRGDIVPVRNTLLRIRAIDNKLLLLVNGDVRRRSYFLDLFWDLAPPSMLRIYEELFDIDKLRLNPNGYAMWQREMNAIFMRLIA